MKIEYLDIKNYKQFTDLTLDLTYPKGHKKEGQPLDKICIIGQSGTGKTNILDIIKKSVIDFSKKQKNTYLPFFEFNKITNTNYITSKFRTKKNTLVETLFTLEESKIRFHSSLLDIEDSEKNYFIRTHQNIKSHKNATQIHPLHSNLLKQLNQTKEIVENELIQLDILIQIYNINQEENALKRKNLQEKMTKINESIKIIEAKYDKKFKSLLEPLQLKNLMNQSIIDIFEESDNLWETIKLKINNYQNERSKYIEFLSFKLLEEDDYSKDAYKKDILKWENENENILDNIASKINFILNKFNLHLFKDTENQKNYNGLIIRDLSNNILIEYEDLSTGTKNLLSTFIPLKTYNPQNSIILIDEPENSFYPDIQRELTDLYMSVGENNQLIMATHSPLIASSFEPWEVVELKFDKNNQIYREKYYEGKNHIDNYTIDPRMLTWTGILTDVFDMKEDSNFSFREKKLMEYIRLENRIKNITDKKEKMVEFEKLMKLSKLLGLSNNEKN